MKISDEMMWKYLLFLIISVELSSATKPAIVEVPRKEQSEPPAKQNVLLLLGECFPDYQLAIPTNSPRKL